ncbi:MAG TPA: TerC/Alx family metal homeostasis membrane protein [Candidatus Binatia bacterium]|nr:TerC/Alx family metal homeostasis membrane protein [Candidatus Binatia bacterium]
MKQSHFEIPPWGWISFGLVVVILLAIDHLAHRGDRAASRKVALVWSIIWIAAGLGFNVFVWFALGTQAASQYLATYVIEKALSTDNMFLFLIVFKSLNISLKHQHTALFWGIAGAVVFRGVLIFLGAAALERWEWVTYIFGAIILYAAYRAFRQDPTKEEDNKLIKTLSKRLPVTERPKGGRFFAREDGQLTATPLFLALVGIELADIMMAVDSVAVAFSMSRSDFVIYTSNVFAILGLRALYLLLANTIGRMRYLHYGLAIVLAFAGFKLMAEPVIDIPPLVSVAFTIIVIGSTVWLSLRSGGDKREKARLAVSEEKR